MFDFFMEHNQGSIICLKVNLPMGKSKAYSYLHPIPSPPPEHFFFAYPKSYFFIVRGVLYKYNTSYKGNFFFFETLIQN